MISRKVNRFVKKRERDNENAYAAVGSISYPSYNVQGRGCRLCEASVGRVMGEDSMRMLGGWGGDVRYRKYTPWTLPRRRKDIFCVGG